MLGLSVGHISSDITIEYGGIANGLPGLAQAQYELGIDVSIWSTGKSIDHLVRRGLLAPGICTLFSTVGPRRWCYSPAMERAAAGAAGSAFDVIHQHSLWPLADRATGIWRKLHRGPTVVAPHAALNGWALKRSAWKKAIAARLYEGANLRSAACLHAVAESEIHGIREYGLRNPIAVMPNGVSCTWMDSSGDGLRFREKYDLPGDKRLMLFLSRVDPVKGLLLLLDGMAEMRGSLSDWILVIAGPNGSGHEKEVRQRIADLNLTRMVQFVGPQYHEAKRDALAACEFLVLPSLSEGAPTVIPEALACGVPVMATHASPWPDLLRYRCGWWFERTLDNLKDALADAASSSPDALREAGARGRALVREQYSWRVFALRSLNLYEWLLGRRDRPDFVVVD